MRLVRAQISTGVMNQVVEPRAGDVDDCAALGTMMAVHAAAPWEPQPSIPRFRNAAGNPDNQGVPDGHTITECARAMKTLWPEIFALSIVSNGTMGKEEVLDRIRDERRPAMIFVRSSALPVAHRYGFAGLHSCATAWDGDEYRLANPLAKPQSAWKPIGRDELGDALRAMPGTGAKAIIMPTLEDAFRTHPLYQAPPAPGECEARLAAKDAAFDEILTSATKGRAV